MEEEQQQTLIIESLKQAFNACKSTAVKSLSDILELPPVIRAFALGLLLSNDYPLSSFVSERGSASVYAKKEEEFAERIFSYVQSYLKFLPYSGGKLESMNVSDYLETFSRVNRQQSFFTIKLACQTMRDTLALYGIEVTIETDLH